MHRLLGQLARLATSSGSPGAAGRPAARMLAAGEMRLVLLALLAERAGHGYELMTRLAERSQGSYRPSAGAIYPTLQQLADEGLLASRPDGGRVVYQLTAAGHKAAAASTEEVEAIWRRVGDAGDWSALGHPDAAEVIGPALRLCKAALKAAARSHGDARVIAELREILEDARLRIKQAARQARRRE